jgi:hypothetical protein
MVCPLNPLLCTQARVALTRSEAKNALDDEVALSTAAGLSLVAAAALVAYAAVRGAFVLWRSAVPAEVCRFPGRLIAVGPFLYCLPAVFSRPA